MKVTVGIIAWNEAKRIAGALSSLLGQTLFSRLREIDAEVEVLVVVNGSTDGTADVAQRFLDGCQTPFEVAIKTVEMADKANAWNLLIHEFSSPDTDYIFCMDADVEFNQVDTLWNMLQVLLTHPSVVVSTDLPLKNIEFKESKGLWDRLQIGLSKVNRSAPTQISAQLYAIRGASARCIWMPCRLIIDDGYIKEMVATDCYNSKADYRRILRAENASHIFQAYTSLAEMFRVQVRQAVGQTINYYLEVWIKELQALQRGVDIGAVIRERNRADFNWLNHFVGERCRGQWWPLYPGALTQRFRRLRNMSIEKRILYFPISVLGFLFDLPALLLARKQLLSGYSTQRLFTKSTSY